jgi:biopolymer transport protein ExbD
MPLKKARLKISDYNEKRKNSTRTHERRVQAVSLSLTSMVDMFAILVIFLLANNNNMTDWLKLNDAIQLPKAKTADIPAKAASIQISEKELYGDSKLLMETKDVMRSTQALSKWLATVKERQGYINVVAHANLSFGIIKRVTAACNAAGFSRINLIVQPTQ